MALTGNSAGRQRNSLSSYRPESLARLQQGAAEISSWGEEDTTRDDILNPPPLTANTPVNPMQQQGFNNTQSAFGNAQDFNRNIMSLQNEQNSQALMNARDIGSGMAREAERGGIQRGGVGSGLSSLLRNQSLDSSLRSTHKLQGELVGEGLRAKNAAMGNEINAAGGTASAANMAAGQQNAMQLGSWAAQNAAQQTLIQQAAEQQRLNQAPYNNLMSMIDSISRNRGAYGALGGGSGGGVLGGGAMGGLGGYGGSSGRRTGGLFG